MGAKQNIETIEQLQEAQRNRDWDAYAALLADDCTFRMAGVPRAIGGVIEGKDAMRTFFQNTTGQAPRIHQVIADDHSVCVVQKIGGTSFPGSDVFKGGDTPWSAYECVVYTLDRGKVTSSTAYVNWADVYVQAGVLDLQTMLK